MAQQAAEGGRRGAQEAGEATRRATQEAGEGARRATQEAAEGAKRITREAAETTRRAAEEATERGAGAIMAAAEIYNETAQVTAQDLQAIATLSSIAAGGLADMRQAWMEWLNRSLRTSTRATQQLLRVKSLDQLADLQRSFLKESFDNLLEGSVQLLRISSRVSEDARRPIEDRVAHLHAGESQQEEQRA
jgi:phasin family protein